MSSELTSVEGLRRMARHCTIIVGVFITFVALKLASHVFIPLVLALFLVFIAWPMKLWLDKYLPKSISYIGSILALSCVLAALGGILWLSAIEIAQHAPAYQEAFQSFLSQAKHELSQKGVSTRTTLSLDDLRTGAMMLGEQFKEIVIIICITLSYVVLALPEVSAWKTKLARCFSSEHCDRVLKTSSEIVTSYHHYMLFIVSSSAINAALTLCFALAFNLDFPVTWAVVIFLLNFLPTLGSSLLPFLMTAVSLVQFGTDSPMPLIVFLGMCALQFIIGFFIEPRLFKNVYQLSPVIVLFSLTFWGFIWGLPGMLLSVPLTMAVVITFSYYKETRWIACMLSDIRRGYR